MALIIGQLQPQVLFNKLLFLTLNLLKLPLLLGYSLQQAAVPLLPVQEPVHQLGTVANTGSLPHPMVGKLDRLVLGHQPGHFGLKDVLDC